MATETTNQATAEVSGEESYAAKLSLGTLGCKGAIVLGLPAGDDKIAIARFYGKVSDVKTQTNNDTGEVYTFLQGNFEGVNMQTGLVLRSGKLYLPKGVMEVMEAAVAALKADESANKKASISFGFEIRAIKATNKAGYSYEAAALKKPEEEDELKAIREMVRNAPTYEQRKLNAAGGAGTGAGAKTIDAKPGPTQVKKSA